MESGKGFKRGGVHLNGLITRHLVFFTDGETCIFEDIAKYFHYWSYDVFIDYYHIMHKVYELLSLAIKHIKLPDPREAPVLYVRGPKKGQVKSREEIFLSRLYARVVSSALFVGNWKEAILYLRNIDPANVSNPDKLNELIRYIWRKRHLITCYAIRKAVGLRNSSNGSESLNNQYVSDLQKGKNKNWRDDNSYAIAAFTCCFKNGEADNWFERSIFSFRQRMEEF